LRKCQKEKVAERKPQKPAKKGGKKKSEGTAQRTSGGGKEGEVSKTGGGRRGRGGTLVLAIYQNN